jgi:hypothetical protein
MQETLQLQMSTDDFSHSHEEIQEALKTTPGMLFVVTFDQDRKAGDFCNAGFIMSDIQPGAGNAPLSRHFPSEMVWAKPQATPVPEVRIQQFVDDTEPAYKRFVAYGFVMTPQTGPNQVHDIVLVNQVVDSAGSPIMDMEEFKDFNRKTTKRVYECIDLANKTQRRFAVTFDTEQFPTGQYLSAEFPATWDLDAKPVVPGGCHPRGETAGFIRNTPVDKLQFSVLGRALRSKDGTLEYELLGAAKHRGGDFLQRETNLTEEEVKTLQGKAESLISQIIKIAEERGLSGSMSGGVGDSTKVKDTPDGWTPEREAKYQRWVKQGRPGIILQQVRDSQETNPKRREAMEREMFAGMADQIELEDAIRESITNSKKGKVN